jgi:hypothetical protein
MSTFKAYAGEGNYTLSVSLRSMLPSQTAAPTASSFITIEDPIEGLYLATLFCNKGKDCEISYFISRGSQVCANRS